MKRCDKSLIFLILVVTMLLISPATVFAVNGPTISQVSPVDNSYVHTSLPKLSAVFVNGTSGLSGLSLLNSRIDLNGLHQPPILLNEPAWDLNTSEFFTTPVSPLAVDDYVLTITAVDNQGNTNQSITYFSVSNMPYWPEGSTLSFTNLGQSQGIRLSWSSASDNDAVSAYEIFKDDVLLNQVYGETNDLTVIGLPNANYRFRVEAVDLAGNVSNSGPGCEVTIDNQAAPESTVESQVFSTVYDWQEAPFISGDIMIWNDGRTLDGGRLAWYDFSSGQEHVLLDSKHPPAAGLTPSVDGKKIVWMDYREGNGNYIYLYDLETGTQTKLSPGSGSQSDPFINGNIVTWTDSRNGNSDIYMYDLLTQVEKPVVQAAGSQDYSAVYGNYIVWRDNRNDNFDIYLYDIANNTEKQLTNDPVRQEGPRIYGDRIVWVDSIGIHVYSIDQGREIQLIMGGSEPVIYEDTLAYFENGEPVVYNLVNGQKIKVQVEAGFYTNPSLDEDMFVWNRFIDGKSHIYMAEVDYAPCWSEGRLWATNASAHSLTLNWTVATDDGEAISAYKIYKNDVLLNQVYGETNDLTVIGLPNANYRFRVEAVDMAGNESSGGPTCEVTINQSSIVPTVESQVFSTVYDWQEGPFVSGDIMTWTNGKVPGKLAWYDFSNEQQNMLQDTMLPPVAGRPSIIDGKKVVWSDLRHGDGKVYMYDLNTGIETQVSSGPGPQFDPHINGNIITWTDGRNGNSDIYMYDLLTQVEKPVVQAAGSQDWSDVYGNYIVWVDYRNNNCDIYLYDIAKGTEKQLTNDSLDQGYAGIYGDRVIWQDNYGIHVYSIGSGREVQLILGGYEPVIYKDKVAYFENGEPVIYNLVSGQKIKVQVEAGFYTNPSLYEDMFVWNRFIDDKSYIYTTRVDLGAPTWTEGRLWATNVEKQSLTLNWTAATDDNTVVSYRVYQDGVLIKNLAGDVLSCNLTDLTPGKQYQFRVEAGDRAGNWSTTGPTVTVKTANFDVSSNSDGPLVPATVDNKLNVSNLLTTTINKVNGQEITSVKLDETSVMAALNRGTDVKKIAIPVAGTTETVKVQLSGDLLTKASQSNAILEVQTKAGTYSLPASEIKLSQLAEEMKVQPAAITINLVVGQIKAQEAESLRQTVQNIGLKEVAVPVEFKVEATAGEQTYEINNFINYVARELPLTKEVDPRKAVGVVLNPDGSVTPVPTQFKKNENGDMVAVLKRKTNSIYTVLEGAKSFRDTKNHWAKDDINLMASKLIVSGVNNDRFLPEKRMTRAEFTAVLVRALGLKPSLPNNPFKDVPSGSWYETFVGAATKAGLINGYGDGTFKPSDYVTKEEAVTLTMRALNFTGVEYKVLTDKSTNIKDAGEVNTWAKESVKAAVSNGFIVGDANGLIKPSQACSRAEVSVMLKRMLNYANLI